MSAVIEEGDEPDFVRATLEWCNARRQEQGQQPLDRLPKGEREDPLSCPCGIATGLYVDKHTFGRDDESRYDNPLPKPVELFVTEFDEGLLPQYDKWPVEEFPGDGE